MFPRYLVLLLVIFSGATARARDTAQFDEGGTLDFPLYPNPGAEQKKYDRDNARLREFVWSHWSQHRRGHIRVIRHGVEGQSFAADHYIGPDSRGRWSMSWAGYERGRIYTIEQIQPRSDFPASRWRFELMDFPDFIWRPGKPLSQPLSNERTNYMLQLRNKKGKIVALF
jgi:hypothetical protein